MLRRPLRLALALATLALAHGSVLAQGDGAPALRVRNHHGFAYAGPLTFQTGLPDGAYRASSGQGTVRGGTARVVVKVPAGGEVVLARTGSGAAPASGPARFAFERSGAVAIGLGGRVAGTLALGLAVKPGRTMDVDAAVAAFAPLVARWTAGPHGTYRLDATAHGYRVQAEAVPDAGGWLDVQTTVTRLPGTPDTAYVALVRRVETGAAGAAAMRWNGRTMTAPDSPDVWDRDFWYTRGLDYAAFPGGGGATVAAVNGFTPGPAIVRRSGAWGEGSHFYVWERLETRGAARFLVAEIAGPNPEQAKSSYMPVTPYAAPPVGRPVAMRHRIALRTGVSDPAAWGESQLHGFAGYRGASGDARTATLDLGVPAVRFGVSYFPFSTFAENFGFYRTPGLDRESWWAISPVQWAGWRAYVPRMRADMRIIRSYGFAAIRLHHLELLQKLPEAEALAYLDFMADECRALGLKMLVDTEGPPDWAALIAGRYRDVLDRVELENEILIPGIPREAPARWTALYRAVKAAAPETDVFLTGVGNHGQFVRLRELGVPFDRIGVHAYKHGPDWPESFASHMLGNADVASTWGLPLSLGEFNWKSLTRLPPAERARHIAGVYDAVLGQRAMPEVYFFHFNETISVNPTVAQNGTRHYEPFGLDRRPKPEATALADRVRRYGPADAPVNEVAVELGEAPVQGGMATSPFRVINLTGAPLTLRLGAECFDHACWIEGDTLRALAPGATLTGTVRVRLPDGELPGLYHHFVRVAYRADSQAEQTAYGWGRAALTGRPTFDAPRLPALVQYAAGPGIVERLDFAAPMTVVYGTGAPVLELETAFMLASMLQAATGRPVTALGHGDLTDSLRAGTLVVVGTPGTNPLVGTPADLATAGAKGLVALDATSARPRLVLTGRTARAAHTAAMDVALRFWPNAGYAAARHTGLEPNPGQPPDRVPENEDTDRTTGGG